MKVQLRRYLLTVPNSAQDLVTERALFLRPLVLKRTTARRTAPKSDERKHTDEDEEEGTQVASGPKTSLPIVTGRESKYRET